MKSLALSLLVALSVSLGAASASAETRQGAGLTFRPTASYLAKQHAEKAAQHRLNARLETEKAQNCLRIARDDDAQGFTYEAGVMRAKAAEHMKAAQASTAAAEREEALAKHYRELALKEQAR